MVFLLQWLVPQDSKLVFSTKTCIDYSEVTFPWFGMDGWMGGATRFFFIFTPSYNGATVKTSNT